MKMIALTAVLSAFASVVTDARAAPELPVPRHDTLQDYQNVCNEEAGFTTFAMQISCIKALVNESTDKFLNKNDPDTQLYLLTADKLADDIMSKRITVANARVNLQRTLIDVESKHQAEVAAIRAQAEADKRQKMAANQAAQEAAQRADQLEEQRTAYQREQSQTLNMQIDQQRESAIEFCTGQVQARQQQYLAAGTTQSNSYALGQQLGMLLSGNSPRTICEKNPLFFQSMPPAPTVTRCQRVGSYDYAQVTCSTN